MTIYWRIGKFVTGGYLLFQGTLWIAYQFPSSPEILQKSGKTLLEYHIHQNLPEYDHQVPLSQSPDNQVLDTFLSETLATLADSLSAYEPLTSNHQDLLTGSADNSTETNPPFMPKSGF
ncbi:MAG: hypothetical protein AAF944_03980 [Bacteroidota bacterium]